MISVAAADKLMTMGKAAHSLVLAPGSFAWQWEDAIHQFTDRTVTYVEAKKKATRTYSPEANSFTVVPWSLFRRDFDKIMEFPWDIIIADEAQEFSNNKSVTAAKMRAITLRGPSTYRWFLTGTAVSTKLEELYTLLYVLDRKFLPPWPEFEERHIVRNDFDVITSYKDLKSLHQHLQYRVDRKTHADMDGEMPELVPEIVKIPQSKEYHEAETQLLKELDEHLENISFDEDGSPKLPGGHPAGKAFAAVKRSLWTDKRRDECLKLIKAVWHTDKVVVFSDLKQPLYDLRDQLNSAWTKTAVCFTGDETAEEKRANVKAFKEDPSVRILLCSDAGNAGLDLPWARYLININVPPSHGKKDQRAKRIVRLSSKFKTVVAYYLVMENSLEEFYLDVVLARGKLASAALEGTADEVVVRPQSLRNFLINARE